MTDQASPLPTLKPSAPRERHLAIFQMRPSFSQPEGPQWISHEEWEKRDAAWCAKQSPPKVPMRDYFAGLERQRISDYERQEGDPGKYVPSRSFPCHGDFRAEEPYDVSNPPSHIVVRCEECGFAMALPSSAIDPNRLVAERIIAANLPTHFLGKPMSPVAEQERARSFCRHWLNDWNTEECQADPSMRLPSPALYGLPGRGKTHLLVATAELLIRRHALDVAYWPLRTLLDKLKEGFDGDKGGAVAAWKRALHVDLLVLDDIGAERPTEWAVDRFAELVDFRYNLTLPILLASNIPPDEWADTFGGRTASRLKGMLVTMEVGGPDNRVAMRPTAGAVNPATGEVS